MALHHETIRCFCGYDFDMEIDGIVGARSGSFETFPGIHGCFSISSS